MARPASEGAPGTQPGCFSFCLSCFSSHVPGVAEEGQTDAPRVAEGGHAPGVAESPPNSPWLFARIISRLRPKPKRKPIMISGRSRGTPCTRQGDSYDSGRDHGIMKIANRRLFVDEVLRRQYAGGWSYGHFH